MDSAKRKRFVSFLSILSGSLCVRVCVSVCVCVCVCVCFRFKILGHSSTCFRSCLSISNTWWGLLSLFLYFCPSIFHFPKKKKLLKLLLIAIFFCFFVGLFPLLNICDDDEDNEGDDDSIILSSLPCWYLRRELFSTRTKVREFLPILRKHSSQIFHDCWNCLSLHLRVYCSVGSASDSWRFSMVPRHFPSHPRQYLGSKSVPCQGRGYWFSLWDEQVFSSADRRRNDKTQSRKSPMSSRHLEEYWRGRKREKEGERGRKRKGAGRELFEK